MKHNSRKRSRNRRNVRSNVHDSNGPDVRIRGTANQVYDKYCSLAKDALGVGDKIMAENYLQHAEHYQRVMNANNERLENNDQSRASKSDNRNNSCKQMAAKNKASGKRRVSENKGDITRPAKQDSSSASKTEAPIEDMQTVATA
jgi:hypothetical protein